MLLTEVHRPISIIRLIFKLFFTSEQHRIHIRSLKCRLSIPQFNWSDCIIAEAFRFPRSTNYKPLEYGRVSMQLSFMKISLYHPHFINFPMIFINFRINMLLHAKYIYQRLTLFFKTIDNALFGIISLLESFS